jgi:hypothetical protein
MTQAADTEWGQPDNDGVCSRYASPARLARIRRANDSRRHVDTLLGNERTLVKTLLVRAGSSVRAKTLFSKAGNARHVAIDAVDFLLHQGWIEVSEKRRGSIWELVEIRWIEPDDLRLALGVETKAARASRRATLLEGVPVDERVAILHSSLSALSDTTLARRSRLVAALDRWCLDQRTGTRVQFSLFAFGDTKSFMASDWTWLERHVGLEGLGISQHTPTIVLRAPVALASERGVLDLRAVPDMISLSPDTLRAVERVEGAHGGWLLIENRTSFEDVARRLGDRFIVVWMPGFVPDWWLEALQHLVTLGGGRAYIAADPDPAGIEIALRASRPWEDNWEPWAMSADDLARTGVGRALTTDDISRLSRLENVSLDATLAGLASALRERGRKGEQEALDLPSRLPSLVTARH